MRLPFPVRRRSGPAHDDWMSEGEILKIDGLSVEFRSGPVRTQAVRRLDVQLHAGEVVGVAGESGSGKTTLALAAMGLLPQGTLVEGSIAYRGTELLGLREKEFREYRGRHLSMIFQETAAALNPVMRVGDQLMMAVRAHVPGNKEEGHQRVVSALADVRLLDTERVMASYPHELSGGMCQRVIIAMALSCGARVLFADEPTTALDVSVQEEILDLIRSLVADRRLAVMLISHDLAVLAEVCDRLVVMYKGEVVETGGVTEVLGHPGHPYTQALLDCLPRLHGTQGSLPELPPVEVGALPDGGCRFRDRCSQRIDACDEEPTLEVVANAPGRSARCWRSVTMMGRGSTRVEGVR